ncbi:hypothetical protein AB7942_29120 [Neobacillus sp. BF23-41]|uniref:hypothetical protein n=1 Tax=Neobacillus sp. BF23-41 TaxID=3240280 RepID=UPI0034E557C9
MDYSSYCDWYMNPYRQYKPVTAYTLSTPVNVNGVNINVPPYQALNYKPKGAQYEYVYVPIAQFSKVGANVMWDENSQTINVISTNPTTIPPKRMSIDMYIDALQRSLACFRNALDDASTSISPKLSPEDKGNKVRYDGGTVFDGVCWFHLPNASSKDYHLTIGKYYQPMYDSAMGGMEELAVINDNGERISFGRNHLFDVD